MKSFLLKNDNIGRDAALWNMVGSMIMSFQQVIFLIILTRTVGIIEAGVFTFAFANANLFLNIGKYGMRNYQVSDVKNLYTFREYKRSRWITTILMIIISLLYTAITAITNDYSVNKIQIIIWMYLFKSVDAIEDVYIGEYQKQGRLDVGAKMLAVRMLLTITFFSLVVIATKNLLLTMVTTVIFTTLVEIVFLRWTYVEFRRKENFQNKNVWGLLYSCLPIALSSFCSFYALNAPKYAIDAQLSDEIQACYGFISMPIFVIAMLNGFIFTPILHKMSCLWNEKRIKEFLKRIVVQSGIILVITILCLAGAYMLGIPVLSWLYSTDLSNYRVELLVLLIGGGFLAWSGILSAVLIIMRYQNILLFCYGAIAIVAFLMSNKVVEIYGMMGAALLYMFLVMLLCLSFLFVLFYGIKQVKSCELSESLD